ncbi:hypothetical protein L484_019847 [Morus notabilis]|uniref:M-phase phosphoprotein 6 n=1 Tax=Morus notabilis TaxID=981085 RepID=W9S9T4_9ROSA|nr:uncharacterized protein LOC21402765 [Morus notabilis]XP_024031682.1 uncharacterized protein LOC21402765 [Morus notabilis]EXC32734.1 hypothetical protein L484_019847 [Morus notabilis]
MAKRELSTTLKNLKFMQRAAQREETVKKEEVKPDGNFTSRGTVTRKCAVTMEGDPHPGAVKGRMSFQSFNPSIDKLNEEATKPRQPASPATSSGAESGRVSFRENGSSADEAECSNRDKPKSKANRDHKRKQSHVGSESQYSNKSPKSNQGDEQASASERKGGFKKPNGGNLDFNLLRRSNS